MATPDPKIAVRSITSDEIPIALELFKQSGRKSDWDKLFGLMLDDQLEESGLLVAVADNQVTGAVWGTLVTRTMAQVIAPACCEQYTAKQRTEIEVALLTGVGSFLQGIGAEFLSCVVATSDRFDAAFKSAGFVFAANVQSMVTPISSSPPSTINERNPEEQLEFHPIENKSKLATLIAETYRGSLDCPIVNDYRTANDFLEAYDSGGDVATDGWFIARDGENDVGCVLINVAGAQAEIVYLGVPSSFRGRNYGMQLVRFAHQHAARRGATTITADVDSKNCYAVEIYQKAGYVAYDFNRVFIANVPLQSPNDHEQVS